MRYGLGMLVVLVAASVLFGVVLLMSWGLGVLIAAVQEGNGGAKREPVPLSSRAVWMLVAVGPVVGGIMGAAAYLILSALDHHWQPGDRVLQMVLGPIIGATVFAPVGLAFLTRRLPGGNIASLMMYLVSMLFVGPVSAMLMMRVVGLRVHGLY